jgi:hypothetical protein
MAGTERPRRRRAPFWIAIAFGVFVFLGISALLARALTSAGNERAAILTVLQAQARGDSRAVLSHMPACRAEPACATQTRAVVTRLRRPGHVEILAFRPSTKFALTRTIGTARVAWRAGTGPPVVQCVRSQREGPLTGGGVQLLSISAPIPGASACR